MSTIDWDAIQGPRERRADMPMDEPEPTPDLGQFTQDDIDSALKKLAAIPPLSEADPDKLSTFWPVVTKFTLADLDFRKVKVTDVDLADLYSTNATLSREKLEEHIESPGQAQEVTPFDKYPIVLQSKKKMTVIDGQHRLAALMLLGVTTWPCYVVPK
jgi:hypothetical protein